MPVQKAEQNVLSGKIGAKVRAAVQAHKDDEIDYGRMELPEGIEGGIAQLVDCKFGVYESGDFKGQPFFYAAGVVKSPREVRGVKIYGLRTQIGPEPICDTPKRSRPTIDDHVAWVINELGKLNGGKVEVETETDLEEFATALKEAQPYFRFRTWKGQPTPQFPDPRVNHVWGGTCEYDEDEEPSPVEDRTGPTPRDHPPTPAGRPAVAKNGAAARGRGGAVEDEPAPGDADDLNEFEDHDLESLVTKANGKGPAAKEAKTKLKEMAVAAGVSEEDVDGAGSWEDVAELIRSGGGESATDEDGAAPTGDEDDDAGAAPEFVPETGQIYPYNTGKVNPKTKKRLDPVECEVVAVSARNETVTLKSLEDGKTLYKGVPWSDLQG